MSEKFDSEAYMADLERRRGLVTVDEGWLTINGPYKYEIALSRVDSAEKILQWVKHLTEKTWIDAELIRAFVVAASRHANLDIDSTPA